MEFLRVQEDTKPASRKSFGRFCFSPLGRHRGSEKSQHTRSVLRNERPSRGKRLLADTSFCKLKNRIFWKLRHWLQLKTVGRDSAPLPRGVGSRPPGTLFCPRVSILFYFLKKNDEGSEPRDPSSSPDSVVRCEQEAQTWAGRGHGANEDVDTERGRGFSTSLGHTGDDPGPHPRL